MTLPPTGIRRELMKGNEAVCAGAIEAGCRFYYGYPITPQNDIPEYMAAQIPSSVQWSSVMTLSGDVQVAFRFSQLCLTALKNTSIPHRCLYS